MKPLFESREKGAEASQMSLERGSGRNEKGRTGIGTALRMVSGRKCRQRNLYRLLNELQR